MWEVCKKICFLGFFPPSLDWLTWKCFCRQGDLIMKYDGNYILWQSTILSGKVISHGALVSGYSSSAWRGIAGPILWGPPSPPSSRGAANDALWRRRRSYKSKHNAPDTATCHVCCNQYTLNFHYAHPVADLFPALSASPPVFFAPLPVARQAPPLWRLYIIRLFLPNQGCNQI